MATESLRQFGDQIHNASDSVIRQLYQATDGNAVTLDVHDRHVLVTLDNSADMSVVLAHPSQVEIGAIVTVQVKGTAATYDLVVTGGGTIASTSGDLDTDGDIAVFINNGLRWALLAAIST